MIYICILKMDQSLSESDVSLSPSKIFERLQMLRQLQLMQRGKLQKHRLQYQDSPEISSSVTEIVSHFSNSTSYNTFSSLLQSSQEIHVEQTPQMDSNNSPQKEIDQDYIEGVSALNLSQESEFITNSPVSSINMAEKISKVVSVQSSDVITNTDKYNNSVTTEIRKKQPIAIKQISLDDMPILSPKKDFEELIKEKLKSEKNIKNKSSKNITENPLKTKKPFLKRGEGMARFGVQKNDLVIQNTKALPWRKNITSVKSMKPYNDLEPKNMARKTNTKNTPLNVQVIEPKPEPSTTCNEECNINSKLSQISNVPNQKEGILSCSSKFTEANTRVESNKPPFKAQGTLKGKHPVKTAKGQTWASVLTKEQDLFLRQLKQSDYYKNFASPAKSTNYDSSCVGTPLKIRQDREAIEQNMFELLENKVTNESFNLNNSFFNRFIRKSNFDFSGESTPIVFQRCLYDNPGLLHLDQEGSNRNRIISGCDGETCSDVTESVETCSSVSTCCSCRKGDSSSINQNHNQYNEKGNKEKNIRVKKDEKKEEQTVKENGQCLNDTVKKDVDTSNMVEMNAKLVATSELLKERLRELEDEIETFRKENASLTKLREDLDGERQKFYEEKTIFEQKYNEEKILTEYYLAEEKEKLNKQKQMYDRYVREMRGKLSKKDKDEVINLKREITELKDEIRNKDAKSTSTVARLRNQIKIIEKERKTLQDEIEKLKKENRRIQHSNDITRRLTNLKYLEEINKKLTHMSTKDVIPETDITSNQKYKVFEIERQSRSKKIKPAPSTTRRSKSVPNLNVTSRYAKYFSKKDSASDKDANIIIHKHTATDIDSDREEINDENEGFSHSVIINKNDSDEENNLEKLYNDRFQSFSPNTSHENNTEESNYRDKYNINDDFFIQKSASVTRSPDHISKTSLSPYHVCSSEASINTSKSPVVIPSYRSYRSSKSPVNEPKLTAEVSNTTNRQNNLNVPNIHKSPVSILSNRISGSHRTTTVIHKDFYSDNSMIPSPEPTSNRNIISKTNLNPTEIKKPDGSRELRFSNGNVKHISADGRYSKFVYYNGDIKENFYDEGRIKYFYAETKTYHTTHADGLEVLEFSDGQIEKRYKDGSSEIRLPNGSIRYYDPKNEHVREEWRFPDGAALTVSATGEQRIVFSNGQVEVHSKDHKRREFPDGTVKLVYNDGTSETRYASGRVRIKDKQGNLIMDSAPD